MERMEKTAEEGKSGGKGSRNKYVEMWNKMLEIKCTSFAVVEKKSKES